jgi:hypothetical protein
LRVSNNEELIAQPKALNVYEEFNDACEAAGEDEEKMKYFLDIRKKQAMQKKETNKKKFYKFLQKTSASAKTHVLYKWNGSVTISPQGFNLTVIFTDIPIFSVAARSVLTVSERIFILSRTHIATKYAPAWLL